MLKNIQETLHLELQNPEVQREFILAYAEEEGIGGVLKALERIAEATQPSNPVTVAKKPMRRRVASSRATFDTVRQKLNAVGLDLEVKAKRL